MSFDNLSIPVCPAASSATLFWLWGWRDRKGCLSSHGLCGMPAVLVLAFESARHGLFSDLGHRKLLPCMFLYHSSPWALLAALYFLLYDKAPDKRHHQRVYQQTNKRPAWFVQSCHWPSWNHFLCVWLAGGPGSRIWLFAQQVRTSDWYLGVSTALPYHPSWLLCQQPHVFKNTDGGIVHSSFIRFIRSSHPQNGLTLHRPQPATMGPVQGPTVSLTMDSLQWDWPADGQLG